MIENYDLFGLVQPDPYGQVLGTGYNRFINPHGMDGLIKIDGDRLNVLFIGSSNPGTGQFREFVSQAKLKFKTICFWHELNKDIGKILSKYGFTPETEISSDGEVMEGYRWDKL